MNEFRFSHDASLIPKLLHRGPIWSVGALCLAIHDQLQARFNPVVVRGEVVGVSQAPSGHCYFMLRDGQGQLRAAMFKRIAAQQAFIPSDGQQVEVTARVAIYEQRGELQLIVESITRIGQGVLLEKFFQLKEKLERIGLFDASRKRLPSKYPRGVGVVTSRHAAAWHDVKTTLWRRCPHIPVILSPSAVQGTSAPTELIAALEHLYGWIDEGAIQVDVILLVRGGGVLEDLWAFNDEQLALVIAKSPVPLISGVGHETDFSIADFVADVRGSTPTAAAELCATSLEQMALDLDTCAYDFIDIAYGVIAKRWQELDAAAQKILRPTLKVQFQKNRMHQLAYRLQSSVATQMRVHQQRILKAQMQLELLHPKHVLDRGFAWVMDGRGQVVTDARKLKEHQRLQLHLAHGQCVVVVANKKPL